MQTLRRQNNRNSVSMPAKLTHIDLKLGFNFKFTCKYAEQFNESYRLLKILALTKISHYPENDQSLKKITKELAKRMQPELIESYTRKSS